MGGKGESGVSLGHHLVALGEEHPVNRLSAHWSLAEPGRLHGRRCCGSLQAEQPSRPLIFIGFQ